MTISQTARLALYRWSEDSDAFTRSQMDATHENLEDRVARFASGTSLPAPDAEYARTLFYRTDEEILYYYNAENGSGDWVALSATDAVAAHIAAKGDLIAGTGSGTADNLAVGSNGQRLIANSATTTGLAWASDTVNTLVDAKGDILAGSSNDTLSRLPVGSNNAVLIANSAQTTGLQWSSTLSGLTLTSPTANGPLLSYPKEQWNVSATAASGTVSLSVLSGSAWLYTTNSTGNWTLNVRGDGTTALSSVLAVGESMSVAFAATNGGTAYYQTGFQIDGSTQTVLWQGGSAPSSGNASSTDVYVFTIIRRSGAYTVFGSQTRFA